MIHVLSNRLQSIGGNPEDIDERLITSCFVGDLFVRGGRECRVTRTLNAGISILA